MKKITAFLFTVTFLATLATLPSCNDETPIPPPSDSIQNLQDHIEPPPDDLPDTPDKSSDAPDPPDEKLPDNTESEPHDTETITQDSSDTDLPDNDGDYREVTMLVREDDVPDSAKVTFEVPKDWNADGTVVGIQDENMLNIMKVDIWNIYSAEREEVVNMHDNTEDEFGYEVVEKKVYSTENYEIFYKKWAGGAPAKCIYEYYLYDGEKFFTIVGYVFTEDKPEHDQIFTRIAESVRFQII